MNLKNCLRVLDQSEYIDERERERERERFSTTWQPSDVDEEDKKKIEEKPRNHCSIRLLCTTLEHKKNLKISASKYIDL